MSLEHLIALVTLSVVSSFTPGPNNTIAAVTGANHGWRAALPHVFGVPCGFATMLLAGSLGVAALLLAEPRLVALIRWCGAAYLLLIAWRLYGAGTLADRQVARPMRFWESAAFQYVNPKAWMMASAACSSFLAGSPSLQDVALIVAVFVGAAICSLMLWAWLGAGLRDWLQGGSRLTLFNRTMALLLGATAVWMAVRP